MAEGAPIPLDHDPALPDRGTIRLWAIAGAIALAGHAGGLAWMLREPPISPADDAPPPAIMIDLAPMPEAINTDMNEISDQMQDAVEAQSDTREPVEQPTEAVEPPIPEEVQPDEPVEEMAEPEPVETMTPEPLPEPDIEPVEEEILPPVEKVEVPLPVIRPRPVEKKPVEKPKPAPKKKELAKRPKRQKPVPASKAATEAAAQVTQSNRNAASQATAGMGFGSISPARWQSRLMAHLERRKRYPSGARSRDEQGTAYVRFRIDDSGNVLSASLARSSGYPELDAEVVELVRRASPVPAPPPDANRTITAPVRFTSR